MPPRSSFYPLSPRTCSFLCLPSVIFARYSLSAVDIWHCRTQSIAMRFLRILPCPFLSYPHLLHSPSSTPLTSLFPLPLPRRKLDICARPRSGTFFFSTLSSAEYAPPAVQIPSSVRHHPSPPPNLALGDPLPFWRPCYYHSGCSVGFPCWEEWCSCPCRWCNPR